MNRNAIPRLSVPMPSRLNPALPSASGIASAVMIAPAYSEPVPRETAQRIRKARPMASTSTDPSERDSG
jgi:hypothetical protein